MEPTEYFLFLTLSTQHNILISIHVAGCIRGLFLFIVSSIHCMNLPQLFIHSPVDGYLADFGYYE